MEVIIQNISKLPIQKEIVYVDIEKHSILFQQAFQPIGTHQITEKRKLYVYVDFDFQVIVQDDDYWIIPKNMNIER